MAELFHQAIDIDDENNPAPGNVLMKNDTTSGTGNGRREGII